MTRRLILEKLPFLILSAASCTVTLLVQQKAMLYHQHLSLTERLANAVLACVRYLGKTFWPQDLVVIYPYPDHWPLLLVVGALVLLLVVSAVVLWNLHRRPYLAVGWCWYLGMLVPVLGLVQVGVQSIADRYTYLPLVGFFVMVAWAASEWLRTAKSWARMGGAAVAVLLLAACGVRTRSQVRVWHDTETLFTHAASVTRGNWLAHYRLALLALDRYQASRRGTLAEQRLTSADGPPRPASKQAAPRDYLQEVLDHCQAALEARGRLVDILVTHAKALTEAGQLEPARLELEQAVRSDPTNPEARQILGEVLYRQGHAREAVAAYQSALELKPDWESVLNNLAWLLATHVDAAVRDGGKAVRLSERACQLTGYTNLWFLHTLAAAYAEKSEFTNATIAAKRAQELAAALGQKDVSKIAAERLELYQRGQALRTP